MEGGAPLEAGGEVWGWGGFLRVARGVGGKGSRSGGGGPALSASVRTISAAKAPGDRLSLLFARCCFRGVFFF